MSLVWFSHRIFYGWGCAVAWRPNFLIMLTEMTLARLPPSIINEHTFPSMVQWDWKMFSHCSSLTPHWLLSTLRSSNISHSSTASSTSTYSSPTSSSSFSFYSSSLSSSLITSYLAGVIILQFGQSEAICWSPWHLNQHRLLTGNWCDHSGMGWGRV